jgi:hypothetical protein
MHVHDVCQKRAWMAINYCAYHSARNKSHQTIHLQLKITTASLIVEIKYWTWYQVCGIRQQTLFTGVE